MRGSMTGIGLGRVKTFRRQAQLSILSQLRAGIDVACAVRRERSGGADAHADAHPSRLDRRDEGFHAEDVHGP